MNDKPQWTLVWVKGAGFVLLGVISLWVTTAQNWDADYVASLKWWNWSVIICTMAANMITNIMAYISTTYAKEIVKSNNAADAIVNALPTPTVTIDELRKP